MRNIPYDELKGQAMDTPLLEEDSTEHVESFGHDRRYKDILFLAIFAFNILCIISLSMLYGVVALSSEGEDVVKVAENGKETDQTTEFTPSVQIVLGMITTLSSAVIAVSLWIFTLSRIANFVLNAILISLIMVPIFCGLVLFFLGYFVFGSALLLLSICLLVMSLWFRPRMDFAAVNLRVACSAVLQMPTLFGYALMAVGGQVLFSILWGIAAVGYATSSNEVTIHAHGLVFNLEECTTYIYSDQLSIPDYGTLTCSDSSSCRACVCDGNYIWSHSCASPKLYGWAYFWLLLSLFWTSAVIANIVHCTVSAAVAKWWRVGYPSPTIVQEGFERAITTSLGSICMGSLLVAVVRTLRSVLHIATKRLSSVQASGLARSIQICILRALSCFLGLLDRIIVYFNRYALCFVAIHNYDFLRASQSASMMFRERGWSMLLNDDIIDMVLNVGHVIIGTVSMTVGYIYGRLTGLSHAYTVLLTVFGFAVGYLISIVALSTISSAVATVYLCYVDDPLALQISHPDMYVPLSEAWMKISDSGPKALQIPRQSQACSGGNHDGVPGSYAPGQHDNVSTGGEHTTKIRGSFGNDGSATNRSQIDSSNEWIGNGERVADVDPTSAGSGLFAAGQTFIATLFPASSLGQNPYEFNQEVNFVENSQPIKIVGSAKGASTRGNYPYSPVQASFDQRTASPVRQPWGPASRSPAQPRSVQQHVGEPVFTHNIAQAMTAISSLTNKLSSSVFGAAGGPAERGVPSQFATVDPYNQDPTSGDSLMSVQLEESFSV